MARRPNVAGDVIFCGPGKNFVEQCECPASKFGLQKIGLQDKKIFKLKLRENGHEIAIDNCFKSRVALQVTAREVMTFFLEICTISDYITRFPKIVARKSSDLEIMHCLVCRAI